jgi:glutamate dehydrogenase
MGELQDRGLTIHLVLHPIVNVPRDGEGLRSGPVGGGAPADDMVRESLIHIHVDRIDRDSERAELADSIGEVLDEVRIAVADWPRMMARMEEAVSRFETNPPPIDPEQVNEAAEFLRWLAQNNFTFLGMREYTFDAAADDAAPKLVDDTGLGILRSPKVKVLRRGREMVTFTPELREFLQHPVPLIVTKANVRSRVHRRAHMDYIGIKLFNEAGELTGELRVVGLFTSTAYTRSIRFIPYLRQKALSVLERSGLDLDSHSGKILFNVLEQYPRDELIQTDPETLSSFALAIMQLNEHPRVRVLSRIDRFDRFVSVLVFVPRERFSTEVRVKIGDYLAKVYAGRVSAFYPAFPEGSLARVHFIIGRYEGETPNPTQAQLEAAVSQIIKTWDDHLVGAIAETSSAAIEIQTLQRRYAHAFDAAYQDSYDTHTATRDIAILERLGGDETIAFVFFPMGDRADGGLSIGLKVYHLGEPIALSDRVPVLENMGFHVINERSYCIEPEDGAPVWLHDMALTTDEKPVNDIDALSPLLEKCFAQVWAGAAENDGYNGLVLRAGLNWREIAVLRAYSRYLRQIRVPFSQGYMWATLNRHSALARELVRLFKIRFDPDLELDREAREAEVATIVASVEEALQAVDSLDEDRIVRRFVNLIRATLRTNVFQRDPHGVFKDTIAFKICSRSVEELPEPRPFREISVYSPRLEGIHMRFGKVARGGLRWSDRPQDFRTEVLGLVKAQQVKNAVIVPVGAKGGFVPKLLPQSGNREEVFAEGVASYKMFISSLLDITDNLEGEAVVPPRRVVRHDDDDPYLVVAADKGTATFSDTANGISEARGFWLGDAFASGGSAGYDHKKMGITARGGWEAVKRHFREMDHDIQTTPFTVVGVGDMSGDVFGNGMLLSDQIRLLAAFDHRDIFIDPDPDPATSFEERKRLFEMGRSSWQDYDKALIAEGGGVFSRREKSIPLSRQMQALLGIEAGTATPNQIMRAILMAKADLMWFGGIGTYIRASTESDEDAGDRANDAIRITAKQLGVKVIGEGANLGVTQRARIEFAVRGGRVNTDAIDNSAGVNSSDMEVNIKIALGAVVREGRLNLEARNQLLAAMTDEVADLVLRNNYLQTLAISLGELRGMEDFGFQVRFMHALESRGLLDREVEDLPDDVVLAEREKAGQPLTRPELAVLLAYAKITLYDRLLASPVPDDEYLGRELMRYFPQELQQRFPEAIADHRLRREIIATMLANSIINRGGPTLVSQAIDQTGAHVSEIAQAFAAVRDSYSMTDLNTEIDKLDNKVSGAVQIRLYADIQSLLREQVVWFLRNVSFEEGLAAVVERYRAGIEAIYGDLDGVLPASAKAQLDTVQAAHEANGVPGELARRLAALGILSAGPDITLVASRIDRPIGDVARTFFAIGEFFNTGRLERIARSMSIADYYDRLALTRTLEGLADAQRQLTALALETGAAGEDGLKAWAANRSDDLERTSNALKEVSDQEELTLSRLAVAASLLRDLVRQ